MRYPRLILIALLIGIAGCSNPPLDPSITRPKWTPGIDMLLEKGTDDVGYYEIWILKNGKKVRRFWFKSGEARDMLMHY